MRRNRDRAQLRMLLWIQLQQSRVELRLDGSNGEELPVTGLIYLVPVGAGVKEVGTRLVIPRTGEVHSMEPGRQQRGAFTIAASTDLTLTEALCLVRRRQHTDCQLSQAGTFALALPP
jgi:hypothetical protein